MNFDHSNFGSMYVGIHIETVDTYTCLRRDSTDTPATLMGKSFPHRKDEKSLLECALYSQSQKKSGQLVAQWAKHCKCYSIDVVEEFCFVNSGGVRKKHTMYDKCLLA